MTVTHDIRWQQRFQSFDRAMILLREPFEREVDTLSALEKEGTIQRFEFAFELAWKTLHDYLEHEGRTLNIVTPLRVTKEAFGAGILGDAQVWTDMLNHRNLASHKYRESFLEQAFVDVRDRYLAALVELHTRLLEQWGSE